MKTRRRRDQIWDEPPRMALTPRDRRILRAVYEFRLLTAKQILKLVFGPTLKSICDRRLMLLYQQQYLQRIFVPTKRNAITTKAIYRLKRDGAKVVAAELNIPLAKLAYWGKRFDRERRADALDEQFLDHLLEINDVRIAVMRSAERHGFKLEDWKDDASLRQSEMRDYVKVTSERGLSRQVALIPDSYFVLATPRRAHFFLELDRGKMDVTKRWRLKMAAYRVYFEGGQFEQRYGTTAIRVLTVTTSAARSQHMQKVTKAATKEWARLFLFTTLAQATSADALRDPLWLRATGGEAEALIKAA